MTTTANEASGRSSLNDDAFGSLRAGFADRVLLVLTAVALVAMPVSMLRSRDTGWLPVYWLQIAILVTLVATSILRRRLSFAVRGGVPVAVLMLAASANLLTYGFATGAPIAFMFAIVIAAILYRPAVSHSLGLYVTAYFLAVGWGYSEGWVTSQVDLNRYIRLPTAWIGYFLFYVPFLLILIHALRVYQKTLTAAYLTLEQRVVERTTELRAAHAELQTAHSQLQDFTVRLDRSVESERRRISREVHDQLGQIFTGLRMELMMRAGSDPDTYKRNTSSLIDDGIRVARRIASELRPPLLDDLGLEQAVKHLIDSAFQGTAVSATVEIENEEDLRPEQVDQLYAIVHEAVTNIVRHAKAGQVGIDGSRDGDHYRLLIENDGQPFDPDNLRPGALGLVGMKERAALAGGNLTITAGKSSGAVVVVRVPIDRGERS